MIKKRNFTNNSLWWLELHILNTSNTTFQYSKTNNVFFLDVTSSFFFFFFLINKKNLNTAYLHPLDGVILKENGYTQYLLPTQTIFFDFKILISLKTALRLQSISSIYSGNSWVERELKEFNGVNFSNLNDTRKLLLNYNYNTDLQYNQYNTIINDIQI